MKDSRGAILYVGKATNLKRRVSSYFTHPHDYRIQKLVSEIANIETRQTDTAIEALILEAELIKKLQPPFNVKEKDDKSFLYVEITKEKFPRVMLARGKDAVRGKRFGPFTSASQIREALRILRRIFPWHVHAEEAVGKSKKACFDAQLGLCPGVCVGAISLNEYRSHIRNIVAILEGKKKRIVAKLEKEMKVASKKMEFEKAEKIKRQLFALQHIQDVALINDESPALASDAPTMRIEGYDISNISGSSAVGSMVVFRGDYPDTSAYRKFRIKTIEGANDVGMLKEVLRRRFLRKEWPFPDVLLVDGGAPQVSAAREILREMGLTIPLVGIAKGPERKRNDIIGLLPFEVKKSTLIKVRDEAHRFAIRYHKSLRSQRMFEKK